MHHIETRRPKMKITVANVRQTKTEQLTGWKGGFYLAAQRVEAIERKFDLEPFIDRAQQVEQYLLMLNRLNQIHPYTNIVDRYESKLTTLYSLYRVCSKVRNKLIDVILKFLIIFYYTYAEHRIHSVLFIMFMDLLYGGFYVVAKWLHVIHVCGKETERKELGVWTSERVSGRMECYAALAAITGNSVTSWMSSILNGIKRNSINKIQENLKWTHWQWFCKHIARNNCDCLQKYQ